MNENARG
jgi:hypothetical protein